MNHSEDAKPPNPIDVTGKQKSVVEISDDDVVSIMTIYFPVKISFFYFHRNNVYFIIDLT